MGNSIGALNGMTLADMLAREKLKNKVDLPKEKVPGQTLVINNNGEPEWVDIRQNENNGITMIPYTQIDSSLYLNASLLQPNKIYRAPDGFINLHINIQARDTTFTSDLMVIRDPSQNLIYCLRSEINEIVLVIGEYKYIFNVGITPSDCSISVMPYVLNTANEYNYTPTSDYHPATKKYVDDTFDKSILYEDEETEDILIDKDDIPTKTSELVNDSGYLTSNDIQNVLSVPNNTDRKPGQILTVDNNNNVVWGYGTSKNGLSVIMSMSLINDETGEDVDFDVSKQSGFMIEYEEDDEEDDL